MIESFSMEFWIVTLFIINFIFVVFLFLFVKKINRLNLSSSQGFEPNHNFEIGETNNKYRDGSLGHSDHASESAGAIIEMLEPLVKESKNSAISFDKQIKEKKRLIKELNDALDSRIISINLLLSRADALQKKIQEKQNKAQFATDNNPAPALVFDQQNQIIEMYNQNFDIDSIAQRLSIPKGEVQLVIDLKKRFAAMEKNAG